jgi:uncharacterized protein
MMEDTSEMDRLPVMGRYVFGLYRRPPNLPTITEAEVNQIQEGHLAHLRRLAEAKELIIAGPFEEDTNLRGVVIFSTSSLDRARELMETDPATIHGRLVLDLYSWSAPAGLRVGPPPKDPTALDFDTD